MIILMFLAIIPPSQRTKIHIWYFQINIMLIHFLLCRDISFSKILQIGHMSCSMVMTEQRQCGESDQIFWCFLQTSRQITICKSLMIFSNQYKVQRLHMSFLLKVIWNISPVYQALLGTQFPLGLFIVSGWTGLFFPASLSPHPFLRKKKKQWTCRAGVEDHFPPS